MSDFSDAWKSRWVNSEHKSDYGEFKLTAGNFYGDAEKDKGKCLHVIKYFIRPFMFNKVISQDIRP